MCERPHDYLPDNDKFKAQIYHHVRAGGAKERRLSHTFVSGHLERRHLHYFKVIQETSNGSNQLSTDALKKHFETYFGDVGDCYQPWNADQNQPWEFFIVGLYKEIDTEKLKKTHSYEVDGVQLTANIVEEWYVKLYPDPNEAESS